MYYICKQITESPKWRHLKVYFSGHDVPGEGEHKIVSYIREQRLLPDYDPNTSHCMTGLDADLILLALATHEPNFFILRETVDFMSFFRPNVKKKVQEVKWQVLHISLLREYIEMDMHPVSKRKRPALENGDDDPTIRASDSESGSEDSDSDESVPQNEAVVADPYDGERAIDDFVFIIALCGNDFVPPLPFFDIGVGTLDRLFNCYRKSFNVVGGYICDSAKINFARLKHFFQLLANFEHEFYLEALAEQARRSKRRITTRDDSDYEELDDDDLSKLYSAESPSVALFAGWDKPIAGTAVKSSSSSDPNSKDSFQTKRALEGSAFQNALLYHSALVAKEQGLLDENTPIGSPYPVLPLKETDFRKMYYLNKFSIIPNVGSMEYDKMRNQIVHCYYEALQWIAKYYFHGCPSWGWFYPFHYGPLLSDLANYDVDSIDFELGKPVTPFEQLVCVLPPLSARFLPKCYQNLMLDPNSVLAPFFPKMSELVLDPNGKANPWEHVLLLPFLDTKLLEQEIRTHCTPDKLTHSEITRNTVSKIFVFQYNPAQRQTIASPMPSLFPTINGAPIALASLTWTQPIDVLKHAKMESLRPLMGVVLPTPGYPTLHNLHFSFRRRKVGINIFGSRSKKETLVLDVEAESHVHQPKFSTPYSETTTLFPDYSPPTLLGSSAHLENPFEFWSSKIGGLVYVQWPHLTKAIISGVANADGAVTIDPSGHGLKKTRINFDAEVNNIINSALQSNGLLSQCGLDLTEPPYLIRARLFLGYNINPQDGSQTYVFADANTEHDVWYHPSIMFLNANTLDTQVSPNRAVPIDERFRLGDQVIVTKGLFSGHLATIQKLNADANTADLQVHVAPTAIPKISLDLYSDYVPITTLCRKFNCNVRTLLNLAGGYEISFGKRVGLSLFSSRSHFMPGYTFYVPEDQPSAWRGVDSTRSALNTTSQNNYGTWYFHTRAVMLLDTYVRRFPKIFDFLKSLSSGDTGKMSLKQVLSVNEIADSMKWWQQTDAAKVPTVSIKSAILPADKVEDLLKWTKTVSKNRTTTLQTNADPACFLPVYDRVYGSNTIVSENSKLKTETNNFRPYLTMRVVNIGTNMAPKGAYGTVIACFDSGYVHVLFDEEFVGGSTLDGVCPIGRGALLPASALLPLYPKQPIPKSSFPIFSGETKPQVPEAGDSVPKSSDKAKQKDKTPVEKVFKEKPQHAKVNVEVQKTVVKTTTKVKQSNTKPTGTATADKGKESPVRKQRVKSSTISHEELEALLLSSSAVPNNVSVAKKTSTKTVANDKAKVTKSTTVSALKASATALAAPTEQPQGNAKPKSLNRLKAANTILEEYFKN